MRRRGHAPPRPLLGGTPGAAALSNGMPLQGILAIVGGIVVGAIALVVFLRNQKRKEGWRTALADVAGRLGLKVTPVPTYYDMARGEIGGLDVDLSIDTESHGDSTTYLMKLEVDHDGDWFTMKSPKAALRHGSQPDKPRTPLGDPSFDGMVEIYGGPPKLLNALRTIPDFRQQVLEMVGQRGVVVHNHDVTLRTTQIATDADTIMGYLEPMLALAQRLEHPLAQPTAPALGTEAARALNFDGLDDETKAMHIRGFIDRIAPNIGPGQSYVDTNERVVDWRGTSSNFPLRIKFDSWPNVEMALKVSHGHGTIDLDCDEDKIPQPGAPPAWDETESQTVFVGKGVYIDGYGSNEELEAFRRLPEQLTQPIIEAMRRDGVRYFRIRPSEITVDYWKRLDEMLDPEGQIVRQAQLLGWVAQYLQSIQPAQTQAQAATLQPLATMKITCPYCSSLYLLAPQGSGQAYGCPNCGAPPRG